MINSLQNKKIKNLIRLNKDNNFRKKQQVFIVEGKQENEKAIQFSFDAIEFFICKEIFQYQLPKGIINFISKNIYEKIAYRKSSEGIIGLYKEKKTNLNEFKPKENSSIVILESIEKPGNLGAILRSCEAFGIDAVIITESKVDFYNPNVIRSSVGCFFGVNIFFSNNKEVFNFLQENNIEIFTTFMETQSEYIHQKNFSKKNLAVLFGSEHSGLSDFWKNKGHNILVPMYGTIDSLNLSNAVAITCYEISKQKNSHYII